MKVTALYRLRCLAAAVILARWVLGGARAVELRGGVLVPVAQPGPGTWPIDADAPPLLLATIAAGWECPGWEQALAVAKAEMEAP